MSTLKVNNITHNTPGQNIVVSDPLVANSVLIGDSTTSYKVSPFNFKNKIINGGMEVVQRGFSFAAAASDTFPVDRFKYTKLSTTGVATLSRADASITGKPFLTYSTKVLVTTADTTEAADSYHTLLQHIEGLHIRELFSTTFTLSFWVKSSKTGTFSVAFSNASTKPTRESYVSNYTITSANTWEFKTITVDGGIPSSVAANFNKDTDTGMTVLWSLSMGSNYRTSTLNSWITSTVNPLYASSTSVNVFDTVSATFELAGVQLEVGDHATDFEFLPMFQVFNQCDRYCQKIIAYTQSYTTQSGIQTFSDPFPFRSPMRAIPTYTELSQTLGGLQTDIYVVPADQFGGYVGSSVSGPSGTHGYVIGFLSAEM